MASTFTRLPGPTNPAAACAAPTCSDTMSCPGGRVMTAPVLRSAALIVSSARTGRESRLSTRSSGLRTAVGDNPSFGRFTTFTASLRSSRVSVVPTARSFAATTTSTWSIGLAAHLRGQERGHKPAPDCHHHQDYVLLLHGCQPLGDKWPNGQR